MLGKILDELELKKPYSASICSTNDDELIIYRSTENALFNIIINPDECITFSYIPNIGKRKLYFLKPDGDFKKLVEYFLS